MLRRRPIALGAAALSLLAAGALLAQRADRAASAPTPEAQSTLKTEQVNTGATSYASAPRIAAGATDSLGQEITVSCASCHANFEPNFAVTSGEQLKEFHQGLQFSHGNLACLACHNSQNYNLLRLAGGQSLDYSQTRTLCGQCHARQARDFERGAHGGMNGYWDKSRGEQIRKTCVDCHDPHAPAIPAMIPTFKPHDRFLEPFRLGQEAPHE